MHQLVKAENPKIEITQNALYSRFTERVRAHLHIILAFSPVGDSFRNNLRMFPALINCCTIDWFTVKIIILNNYF